MLDQDTFTLSPFFMQDLSAEILVLFVIMFVYDEETYNIYATFVPQVHIFVLWDFSDVKCIISRTTYGCTSPLTRFCQH